MVDKGRCKPLDTMIMMKNGVGTDLVLLFKVTRDNVGNTNIIYTIQYRQMAKIRMIYKKTLRVRVMKWALRT